MTTMAFPVDWKNVNCSHYAKLEFLPLTKKIFMNTADCGHANRLVSKGIVVMALRPGQAATEYEIPFEIRNHIWKVLKDHHHEFSCKPGAHPTESLDAWLDGIGQEFLAEPLLFKTNQFGVRFGSAVIRIHRARWIPRSAMSLS